MSDETISECPHAGCGYRCCEFDQDNYIVTYPGELDNIPQGRQNHLQVIDADYHGGKKVICIAKDKSTCDGGYKPADCASYPFFPGPQRKQTSTPFIKGEKCPLTAIHLKQHRKWVAKFWSKLVQQNPEVGRWLKMVSLVGYKNFYD